MNTFNFFFKMVDNAYENLSSREKLLADSLMQAPSLLVLSTASQLAKSVDVSNSTVTRFIRKIGFDSFEQAQEEARSRLRAGSPLTMLDAGTGAGGHAPGTQDEISQFLADEQALLRAAFADLTPDQLDDITTLLTQAPKLAFLGFRNSHFFASYAHWQFIQFRENVHLLNRSGETIAENIAHLKEGDIVLAVGVRRLVSDFEQNLRAIASTGADILLITDPSSRKISPLAKWTLFCPVENAHAFDSYAGVLSIIRLLAYKAFVKSGEDGKRHMNRIEEYHETLMELN